MRKQTPFYGFLIHILLLEVRFGAAGQQFFVAPAHVNAGSSERCLLSRFDSTAFSGKSSGISVLVPSPLPFTPGPKCLRSAFSMTSSTAVPKPTELGGCGSGTVHADGHRSRGSSAKP